MKARCHRHINTPAWLSIGADIGGAETTTGGTRPTCGAGGGGGIICGGCAEKDEPRRPLLLVLLFRLWPLLAPSWLPEALMMSFLLLGVY